MKVETYRKQVNSKKFTPDILCELNNNIMKEFNEFVNQNELVKDLLYNEVHKQTKILQRSKPVDYTKLFLAINPKKPERWTEGMTGDLNVWVLARDRSLKEWSIGNNVNRFCEDTLYYEDEATIQEKFVWVKQDFIETVDVIEKLKADPHNDNEELWIFGD